MNSLPIYIQAILVFLTPLLISLTMIPYILKAARKWKLFDHPDIHISHNGSAPRKIHTQPTPRLGGIAMVAGYYLSVALWSWNNDLWKILLPSLAIFFIGLRDDVKDIPAKIRLLLQLLVSALTVYLGGLEFKQLIFTPTTTANIPYIAGFILSTFILTGAINAINMVDGLDGLAGGLVLITTTLLGYLYFLQTGNPAVFLIITLPLAGSILGFLRYNTYPSKIFMGDGGSNWLGFITGQLLLIVANYGSLDKLPVFSNPDAFKIPFISVLLCMSIPILDTAFVITTRLLRGKSPVVADKIHFHHGLMKIGLKHPNAVMLIYFISLSIGITGFFPILFQNYSSWSIPYVVPVLLLLLLYIVMKLEEDAAEKIPLYQILFSKGKELDSGISSIFNIWLKLNQNILFIILLAIPVFAGSQSPEVGLTAGIVFVLLIASHLFQFWKNDFLDIFIISLGAIVLLIANNSHEVSIILMNKTFSIHSIYNSIFIFLAISTGLFLILTFKKQYLLTSPTDFLMLILPLLLLLAPQSYNQKYSLTLIALRSLVLFLSLLTAFKFDKRLMEKFRTVIIFSLIYVFFTGYLGMKIVY